MPSAPLFGSVVVFFVVSNRFGLKCVMARGWLDAILMSQFLELIVSWGVDVVIFGARNLAFGMPFASPSTPGRTIERSRGNCEHK